ncbi:ABC transporter substrate-binding protein [Bifidobacterium favimelis]|uniref:Thiamine pyrimidine synthase n=1 Tax=Bifidobacterium favimelis TaxID=3122979 RepID=A0ABU8ZPB1_9BIFI
MNKPDVPRPIILRRGRGQIRTGRRICRKLTAVACMLALGAGLTACAGAGPHPSGDRAAAHEISFMLDWTPNTNHVGIYVARHLGYFDQAGISVKILPTAQAGAEVSVQNGVAEVGFSKLSNLATFDSQGADLVQVFNLGQRSVARWCSLASRTDIKTPKDFDGKTFVTFGSAEQTAVVRQMIRYAGGRGEFSKATSGTNTFATLTSGRGDFAGFYVNWEGVESELKGPALHCFTQSDWGVPGNPDQLGFVVRRSWLDDDSHRQTLRAFVQACLKGYNQALRQPDQAARILVEETKGSAIDPELARRSMESIAREGYWTRDKGGTKVTGLLDLKDAQDYLDFQYKAGTYKDAKKGERDKAPQAGRMWTDRYVR